MALTRKAWIWTLSVVITAGAVATAGAAWAITASHNAAAPGGQTGSGAAESTPRTVPALYTGDELTWLMLPDDTLSTLLGASDIQPVKAEYHTVGESEGVHAEPEQCTDVAYRDDDGMIGIRATSWSQGGLGGSMTVRQFASAEQASANFDKVPAALPSCSAFEIKQIDRLQSSETISEPVSKESAEAKVVVFDDTTAPHDQYNHDHLQAVLLHGNLVLNLYVGHDGPLPLDQGKLVEALLDQARTAQEKLTQELG
ncbi:sensor domain-containing protein [Microbacterium sp. 22242]|uniref:sensor domain-containing protein n=1 Tax=Microbacterium sp. 22242 TaxID=3453896 RepID=UPI003F848D33